MPKQPIDCPVCGSVMQKRTVGDGVEVDYCDWHGVWLDAGELERFMPAARQQSGKPARNAGVGKAIGKGLAGAAVVGAGFHLGGRLVGGILDGIFKRR